MTQSLATNPDVFLDDLEARSRRFEALLLEHAMDTHGIVRANTYFDPVRPLRPGDLGSPLSLHKSVSPEDFHAYEDAGMASGAYLASQAMRFRVTGNDGARRAADSAYAGVRHIYELGAAARKPGYFPKPYGGRASDQISRDQYLFVMTGLATYLTITDRPRAKVVADMLVNMARHWMDIGYTTSYFGLPRNNHLDDFMGSLFLGILAAAARASGDPEMWREYERLRDAERLGDRMAETHAAMYRSGKTYDGGTYYRQSENAIMMKAMAADLLYDCDAEHRDLWDRALLAFWEDDLRVPLDYETGLNHHVVGFNAALNRAFMTEPGVIEELENPLKLATLNWGGRRQHAGSSQTAFAAALIADRVAIPEARDIACRILQKLTLDRFRGLTVPNDDHIPPGHHFEQNLLNTGYIAYWLWTYWLMRERFQAD